MEKWILTLSLDRDNKKKQIKRINLSENKFLEHGNGMSVFKRKQNGHAIERLLFNWERENRDKKHNRADQIWRNTENQNDEDVGNLYRIMDLNYGFL